MKLKRTKIKKYYEGEVFTFINGKAKVPGCQYKGRPLTITLKEFASWAKGSIN